MLEPIASDQNPPTPYYSDESVTLFLGDCREVLAWLEADVLITDPPYGTAKGYADGIEYGRRATRASGYRNDLPPGAIANDDTTEVRDEALSMWQARGPALCFGSPRQADPPGEWADRLVWDKKRPGMNGGPWRYRHESIFVTAGFVRTSDAAVSIIEAWPDQKDHIHAKPLALMLRLVAAAPPGVIADPFAGSGSTLVAAKQLGRKAIGVELDAGYCEIIARRLDQGVLDFGAVS
jgi:site-specific DNA-methyltransferase (adenine-specific)